MPRVRLRAAALAACASAAVALAGLAPASTPASVVRDVPYGVFAEQRLDVHLPRPTPRQRLRPSFALRPAVVVVHGGAWAHGDKRKIAPAAVALARAGFVAFNVNYALAAPGLPGFPQQLRDLRRAVRWIRLNAARYRIDPRRIGALGTSAGGHLAALLATATRGPLTAGDRVAALVTWSAPFDLPALHPRWQGGIVDVFLGCRVGTCPARRTAASPRTHVSSDDPPALLVNARREFVPLTQPLGMADALAAGGVPQRLLLLEGALHGRELAPAALGPSIAFLKRRLR